MNQTQSFLQFVQTKKMGLNVMIRIEGGTLVATQCLPLHLAAETERLMNAMENSTQDQKGKR